jgi:catechol 2,3-dioxygenase
MGFDELAPETQADRERCPMQHVTAQRVRFSPRRLGHANLFVGDLNRSLAFYNGICGLEEVRREPGIGAGFLSNGNTHHDVGLMQTMAVARVGRGGHVQVPHGRGALPGLNHFGWEMESEASLVAAYRRALDVSLKIHRTSDHQLSHSVYVSDPDGNLHEFYADIVEDWRTVFNPEREDLITSHWDPLARAPVVTRYYKENPEWASVPGALFHPKRITHAVLVAQNFLRMRSFFLDIAGLDPVEELGRDGVILRGKASHDFDLALFASRDDLAPGVHHLAFEISDEMPLIEAERQAKGAVQIELVLDRPDKRSVFVHDPDGMRIEFYARRHQRRGPLENAVAALRPYLV